MIRYIRSITFPTTIVIPRHVQSRIPHVSLSFHSFQKKLKKPSRSEEFSKVESQILQIDRRAIPPPPPQRNARSRPTSFLPHTDYCETSPILRNKCTKKPRVICIHT